MKCKTCGVEKSKDQFYNKHKECKDCGRARSLSWRNAHIERARQRTRDWNHAHKELRAMRERERRERDREHQKVLRGNWYQKNKEKLKKGVSDDRKKHTEREHAHNLFKSAKRAGRVIVPSKCSRCGKKCRPVGHHEDYSKPYDVIWLCNNCHVMHHKGKY